MPTSSSGRKVKMTKRKYLTGGTKVVIKGSPKVEWNGKKGVLSGDKDMVAGRKVLGVLLRGKVTLWVNKDYLVVA